MIKPMTFSRETRWWACVCVILLLGLGLRLYALGRVPVALYRDEVAILLDAHSIAETGLDIHGRSWLQPLFPSYGDYKLAIYIWLAALSTKVFGVTAFALRFPSLVAGLGTIIVGGFLAHELIQSTRKTPTRQTTPVSDWTSLATMAILALSPWSILFSRAGFEGHVAQFFLGISVVALLKSRTSLRWLIPAILFSSLATYTYFSVRFVWPLIVVGALPFFAFLPTILERTGLATGITSQAIYQWLVRLGKTILVFAIVPLALYTLSLQPMLTSDLYEVSNQFRLSTTSVLNSHDYALESNKLRELAGNTILDRVLYHRHVLLVRELAKNIGDHLNLSFIFLTGDSNLRHGTGFNGLFLWPLLPCLVIGFYRVWTRHWTILIILIAWWLAALLPASVPENTPHALRSLNALLPMSVLLGFGLITFLDKLSQVLVQQLPVGKVLVIGYFVVLGISLVGFYHYYLTIYPAASAYEWQDGYPELAQRVLAKKGNVEKIWFHPFEDKMYLWLWLYGKYDPALIQNTPTQHYIAHQVDTIVFETYDWKKINEVSQPILVVGEVGQFDTELEKLSYVPEQEVISTADGVPRFVILTLRAQ